MKGISKSTNIYLGYNGTIFAYG